ncbi:hypothetical protein C2G38_2220690 [Gigaspora rosea]|uniref:Uncharacterized protein n=1 Tax=Gigaspora rosea TaxID=44941 RepID=A0A397U7K5_9GLOM|nr:hypothetical protein C2G38_2220690 [Gigaspora rosea]
MSCQLDRPKRCIILPKEIITERLCNVFEDIKDWCWQAYDENRSYSNGKDDLNQTNSEQTMAIKKENNDYGTTLNYNNMRTTDPTKEELKTFKVKILMQKLPTLLTLHTRDPFANSTLDEVEKKTEYQTVLVGTYCKKVHEA